MDIQEMEKDLLLARIYRFRYKLSFICFIIIIVVSISDITKIYHDEVKQLQPKHNFIKVLASYQKRNLCYRNRDFSKEPHLVQIDDILLNNRQPRKGKTIFFHETSCSKNGKLKVTARQACAIESAALLNPNYDIFVLFASPISYCTQNEPENFNIQEALKLYKNIFLRNVNIWSYANDTPTSDWISNGVLFHSHFIEEQVADFLRLLTLWRWGGTHLDLDVISKKTLENIKPNFAGAESTKYIANGIINLDYDNFGHKLAGTLLQNCLDNFHPNIRSSIGPPLLTKVLQRLCKTTNPNQMTRDRCSGFKVFEKDAFYPIEWGNWEYYFQIKHLNMTLSLTRQSIAIHIWNKVSQKYSVKVDSKVAYTFYAQKYCPNIYSTCNYF